MKYFERTQYYFKERIIISREEILFWESELIFQAKEILIAYYFEWTKIIRGTKAIIGGNDIIFKGTKIIIGGNKIINWGNEIIFRGNEIIIRGAKYFEGTNYYFDWTKYYFSIFFPHWMNDFRTNTCYWATYSSISLYHWKCEISKNYLFNKKLRGLDALLNFFATWNQDRFMSNGNVSVRPMFKMIFFLIWQISKNVIALFPLITIL